MNKIIEEARSLIGSEEPESPYYVEIKYLTDDKKAKEWMRINTNNIMLSSCIKTKQNSIRQENGDWISSTTFSGSIDKMKEVLSLDWPAKMFSILKSIKLIGELFEEEPKPEKLRYVFKVKHDTIPQFKRSLVHLTSILNTYKDKDRLTYKSVQSDKYSDATVVVNFKDLDTVDKLLDHPNLFKDGKITVIS